MDAPAELAIPKKPVRAGPDVPEAGFGYAATERAKYEFAFGNESAAIFALTFAAIVVPIMLHAQAFPNQLIAGTLVNALLAGSALYVSFKKSLPIILLPSLAALASGLVFGGFTVFLAYLVPFIWLGNAVYVYSIKNLKILRKISYAPSLLAASLLKAFAIALPTFALIALGIVPQAFLVPMSVVQFATAAAGGAIAGTALLVKK